ncbi:hypothetical protein ACIBQ0_17285 [Nocardia nova]|uniref:hypothetical protein n=1 Tax=Nocardia nova TaxID=37330 RepID=UPI003790B613
MNTQQEIVDALKKQGRDIHSTRIFPALAGFGIVLDLALTIGFGFLYHQVDANQNELREVQARTSTEILCPLYEFFALSLKVNPPPPTANEEQIQLRKSAGDTIAKGLTTLGCKP